MGRVKAVISSPTQTKELLVTLIALEKTILEDKNVHRIYAYGPDEDARESGIFAVPVSKKLPWMHLEYLPAELI
jgi:hypothetical protein